MTAFTDDDPFPAESLRRFTALVNSVGIKRFSASLGLSTRQVNRILAGVQPNPVERLIRALQSADARTGDEVLDFVCEEMGGHFVRQEAVDAAAVNAVRECAEAIAAISDGQVSALDMRQVREAISALSGLILSIRSSSEGSDDGRRSPERA